ncbi:MAG: phytoene/squalene synthase family protein [Myxococcota bacterium]|nr:phytoene/squalene synthase family protein [Myxococcota bacterium]
MRDRTPAIVAESRDVLAHHARTFNLASVFLTPAQRDDAAVVYAFCRTIDDLVDEAAHPRIGRQEVEAIRSMVEGRTAPTPLVEAFLRVADRTGFALHAATDLMDGVLSDVGDVTVQDDGELIRYGYSVAGTVGLMMCGVIGVSDDWALSHAIDLGIAMQITNICRDVAEDAGRGRVYLPAARLRLAGVEPDDLRDGRVDPATIAPVVEDLLHLADEYYRSGDQGMKAIPARPRLAIFAASRVYRAIGAEIRRNQFDITSGRAVVPQWRKIAWVTSAITQALICPMVPSQAHNPDLHSPLNDFMVPNRAWGDSGQRVVVGT